MPGSYNLPYELDAKGTGYSSRLADRRHAERGVHDVAERRWRAPADVLQVVQLGPRPSSAPITFDTLFKPGTKPLDVIYPAVEQDLQKQQGVIDGIPPSVGLDPSKYQNFAITDDSLIFFFSQGELFAGGRGACAGVRPARDAGRAVGVAPTPARSRTPGRRWWR